MAHSLADDRHYVIISVSDVVHIDFSKVLETSSSTLRTSRDGSKTFIKYIGDAPDFLGSCSSKSDPYSHEDFLQVISTDEWSGGLHDS